ncbi:red chlorophyll catabolite reductase, chloroplastic-like [Quercus robur]|uniref:red chlorophyll catabolite reductase, chloroplastic-like n=1 Tax=Quercus robur TaxID=38942 RepID=UPI002161140B|nr:red chlorophyll catabolite reductase, chloroplastic-like [Quercus robur]
MAVRLTLPVIFFSSHFSPSSSRSRSKTFSSSASSSQMELNNEFGVTKFKEFPYLSAPHRNLMVDLVSTVENRLGSQLLPCSLPPDVQYYQNQTGSAHASLHTRSGNKPSHSQIDFILGSWIHCELPTGGALNITSLSAFLNPLTDAPNFLIELIQSSPTSLILILDLPPRKDLVLCPDYLHTFYEETQLDTRKQILEKIPEVKPYISSSLYIRSLVSPTAIMVRIETEASQPGRVEEVIKDHVDPIAKEVLGIWLDQCACGKREVGEAERAILEKRDGLIKIKTIEVDLGSNFPRLFGPEVADRILGAMRDVFTV